MFSRRSQQQLLLGVLLAAVSSVHPCELAADQFDARKVAQQLLSATVTVRATNAVNLSRNETANMGDSKSTEVTVCTGTYVGNNLILSVGCLPQEAEKSKRTTEYRITLPGGKQATAQPLVADERSSLVLLELDGGPYAGLAPLPLGNELPDTGGIVLTAAAEGVEQPLVSQGILSGKNRVVPGTDLPPLLVCDISTTESSSGAAVVNQHAQLVGLVAVTSTSANQLWWSYALPVDHVRRVLEARIPDRFVMLVRERPTLGLTLGPGNQRDSVVVQHVVPDGPSDRAGIDVGDRVVAIDGRMVRSVYQAGALVRRYSAGDYITLACISPTIKQAGDSNQGDEANAAVATTDQDSPAVQSAPPTPDNPRLVSVKLGGQAVEAAPNPMHQNAVKVRLEGPSNLELQGANRSYRFYITEPADAASAGQAPRPTTSESPSLGTQLAEYERIIATLQIQANWQQQQLAEQERVIQSLRTHMTRIRQQIESSNQKPGK